MALALTLAAALLIVASDRFRPEHSLADIPSVWLATGGLIAGLTSLLLLPLLRTAAGPGSERDPGLERRLLALVIVTGVGLRLLMLWTVPALEVDYLRYLWDGAMTANGHNPYAASPKEIADLLISDPRSRLAGRAGDLVGEISYPEYRTVYPPVAQAAFALAHALSPFSLTAWRLVCLAGECATLVLLLALLRDLGRPALQVALYWWNPLVIKELMNSAHMEAILVPCVLGCLLLALRRRTLASVLVLGLAAGVKLWPVVLAPIVLAPLTREPRRLLAATALLAGLLLALAAPVFAAGFGERSGLVAFATHWRTNSALFPLLEGAMARALAWLAVAPETPGRLVRGLSALVVVGLALRLALPPPATARDTIDRALVVVSALVLLSPAQFPWYLVWVLPLATLRPTPGWLVAAALAPIYYSAFHFHATGAYPVYRDGIVWLVWLPVWLLLIADLCRASRPPR